jgi:hypothetical protein
VSSSFPIDLCQIKELLLDDFDLRVSHSPSGNPITKVNQRVNRFHAICTFGYAPQNARAIKKFEIGSSTARESAARLARSGEAEMWYKVVTAERTRGKT